MATVDQRQLVAKWLRQFPIIFFLIYSFCFVFFFDNISAHNEGWKILLWPNVNCKQINQPAATAVHDLFSGRSS